MKKMKSRSWLILVNLTSLCGILVFLEPEKNEPGFWFLIFLGGFTVSLFFLVLRAVISGFRSIFKGK